MTRDPRREAKAEKLHNEQHKAASVACEAGNEKRNATIATKVLPAKKWWDAEEYHASEVPGEADIEMVFNSGIR